MSEAPAPVPVTNGAPVEEQTKAIEEAPGFKVFAGNLSYATTDEGLRTFFAPVADDILTAQVIQRGTRSAGYGFVALKTEDAVAKAVELLEKKELDGREVMVQPAKPAEIKDLEKKEKKAKRRPGRRGSKAVPGEVTDAEANGESKAEEVDADGVSKPKKKKKKSKAAKAKDAVEGAVASVEGAVTPKKKASKKKPARAPRAAGEDPVGEPSKTVLFVANLGFNIEDAGLAELFTEAGIPVTSARIVRRRWGQPRRSKGYGFVDVGDEAQQNKAIEALQGKDVGGRQIAVKIAVNTPEDEDEAGEPQPDVAASEAAPVPATTVAA
jgi:RNA recognition motif-containing protein